MHIHCDILVRRDAHIIHDAMLMHKGFMREYKSRVLPY